MLFLCLIFVNYGVCGFGENFACWVRFTAAMASIGKCQICVLRNRERYLAGGMFHKIRCEQQTRRFHGKVRAAAWSRRFRLRSLQKKFLTDIQIKCSDMKIAVAQSWVLGFQFRATTICFRFLRLCRRSCRRGWTQRGIGVGFLGIVWEVRTDWKLHFLRMFSDRKRSEQAWNIWVCCFE